MSNLNDVVGAPACGTTDPALACGTKGPAPACGTACDSADSKAAPACGSAKLSVGVSSMNVAELPDMISLAARIGADVFAFGRYCPTKGQRLEKCNCCKLRGWRRGCPAVAAGYTGNRYAPDPQCWMEVD